ncbi:probable 1-acyl-sn-glycerol-3-phosphate acyltransferase 5 isoform X2 [Oryza sativa Japonica Group]|uniref:probable 1-acyl-sn-glycerol-3-phosphate acyltransferase 5 isoform X2 n=1 Tax=Oryza sativa subsp. japonica TaxID=39947 RepID=UPI00339BA70C
MMNGSNGSQGYHVNGKQVQSVVPSIQNNGPRHRPLTLMRRCRGMLCLVIMPLTAFMMMVYLSPVTTFLIRLFSVHYSRKSTCFLFGMWLAMWPFLFEKINKTKFVFSGETVPPKERVLLFANHRTEVDWMYLWDLALRKGRLQCIKYILKKSLMKLPIFNWAFHIIEFIPVERKWEVDEPLIRSRLSELKNPKDPLWLAVFPEGTDYTEKKCIKSQEYAKEHGLPILNNVLLPKTKGFHCCLQELRDSMDSEDEVADWLIERFKLKNKLLSDFSALGHFPNEGTEDDLSTLKCIANFVAVISTTTVLTYLTLFSSVWFKIFVAFSSAFLTFATLYSIHLPQLICSPEAGTHAKKS